MLRLFSRPVRPAGAARRQKFTVTRLEVRDCPAAPVVDMTVTPLGGNTVQITGTVLDESPQDCLVNLGGVTTPISFVNSDGTFDIVTTLPGTEIVTAFAVDEDGVASQLRAVPANSAPSIVDFGIENQGGCYVISGRVVDENPDTCTVLITSSIPDLNNRTLHTSEGGYFTFSFTPATYVKSGSVRLVARDEMGLTSAPIDDWIG